MGPKTCSGLKAKLSNDVACQGVGRPYTAGLVDNVSASGTTQAAIGEATRMFTMTNQKCPASIIVAGGYRYVYSSHNSK
jgi:cutinase